MHVTAKLTHTSEVISPETYNFLYLQFSRRVTWKNRVVVRGHTQTDVSLLTVILMTRITKINEVMRGMRRRGGKLHTFS
jgi:hypothetical protein